MHFSVFQFLAYDWNWWWLIVISGLFFVGKYLADMFLGDD